MKEVTFAGCGHIGLAEDHTRLYGGSVLGVCPRCMAVSSPDELFVDYHTLLYYSGNSSVAVKVIALEGEKVTLATANWKPEQATYEEWIVQRHSFQKKGDLFVVGAR